MSARTGHTPEPSSRSHEEWMRVATYAYNNTTAKGMDPAAVPALVAACEDLARQLDNGLSVKLGSDGAPGHCDYISKRDAGTWCAALAEQARAALAAARPQGQERAR